MLLKFEAEATILRPRQKGSEARCYEVEAKLLASRPVLTSLGETSTLAVRRSRSSSQEGELRFGGLADASFLGFLIVFLFHVTDAVHVFLLSSTAYLCHGFLQTWRVTELRRSVGCVVERLSLTGELSLSYARPTADG